MRLVPKLTLAFVAGMSVILAGNAFLRVRREISLFESERTRDHHLIGTALATAVAAIWKLEGGWRAMAVVEQINAKEDRLHIQWTPSPTANAASEIRQGLARLEPFSEITTDGQGARLHSTYIPVSQDGHPLGALDISESFASEQAYVRKSIVDTVFTALLLAGVCSVLAVALNMWLVGRPVELLAQKARRVGRGDFSAPVHLPGRDELAELGREMNTMCNRLVQTVEQLRQADRLATVGKLSSGLAHELGTPLNVISARAEMIAVGEVDGKDAADYARIIVQASERLTRIVRRLLDFARRKELQKAPQDLGQLARQTMDLLRPLAEKKKIALRMSEGSALTAEVDGDQVQQVLTNFLMNAIQAMSAPGTIDVTLYAAKAMPPGDPSGPQRDYVCLTVADQGVGMSSEQMAHIFEPFFTTKEVGEGTGLGLSVAYGIVEDHGGWIAAESEPGNGSRFSMYLPTNSQA